MARLFHLLQLLPPGELDMIKRRQFISLAAGSAAAVIAPGVTLPAAEPPGSERPRKTGLGLVTYCAGIRNRWLKQVDPAANLFDPTRFLAHCEQLGAGGMQISLAGIDEPAAAALRDRAQQAGLYIEAIIKLPSDQAEVGRFDKQMRVATVAGALAVRTTIIPGRRYEFFDSLEKFRTYETRGRRALELAAPIAEKHQLPIAVENHKDHRNAERVALLEQIDSPFVGACVDTGNSIALLEDPLETATALAPWAHSVHLKDQAVQPYPDGFLLGDIPLGQGYIDLQRVVAIIRKQKPNVRFSLELITRDPLKVPCLTDSYWATFPTLPGRDLARTLRAVKTGAADKLQYITALSPADQLAREDADVRESLDYARDHLKL